MAINVNRVTLVGRVGKDPEKKGSGDGFAVFSVATSRTWKQDGEKKEKTEWHSVTVFAPQSAKFCLQYVKKGDLVHIEGRLETSSYDKDGVTMYSTKVVVAPFDGSVQAISKEGRSDSDSGSSRGSSRDSGRDERQSYDSGGGSGGSYMNDDEIPF